MIAILSGLSKSFTGWNPPPFLLQLNTISWSFPLVSVYTIPSVSPHMHIQITLDSNTEHSAFRPFQAPHTSSLKQPDSFFQVQGQYLPTIVGESGWTETTANLHRDMRLWLIGDSEGRIKFNWFYYPSGQCMPTDGSQVLFNYGL